MDDSFVDFVNSLRELPKEFSHRQLNYSFTYSCFEPQ